MNQRKLLLLGLLRTENRHGYEINDFIEKNLSACIEIKRSTAYSTLDALCASGHVAMHVEQAGNRPPRKVYSLTAEGGKLFDRLLRESLTKLDGTTASFETGLVYIDALSPEERVSLLSKRARAIDIAISALEAIPSHGDGSGVDISVSHRRRMLKAEHEWLSSHIERWSRA